MEGSSGFHEAVDDLGPETRDRHRAVVSLTEELEAMDWYDQRIEATRDPELRRILEHNRDEEKEHAAMLLGWLCRRDPLLAAQVAEHVRGGAGAAEKEAARADGSLGIGPLRTLVRGAV